MFNINELNITETNPTINNVEDISKIYFKCTDNPLNTIKWCRRNFGERGDGWDFIGNHKGAQITIWNSKLVTMYVLYKGL